VRVVHSRELVCSRLTDKALSRIEKLEESLDRERVARERAESEILKVRVLHDARVLMSGSMTRSPSFAVAAESQHFVTSRVF
jgi:hypothetical protein